MKTLTCLFSLAFVTLMVTFAQAQDEKGAVLLSARLSMFPGTLSVTECCGWTGTWQRRLNTNVYDATWKHTNGTSARDVLELKSISNSNEVVFYRQSMNGQYKAIYNPTTKVLSNGTATWYPSGATWSAKVVEAAELDEKGRVNLPRR